MDSGIWQLLFVFLNDIIKNILNFNATGEWGGDSGERGLQELL